MQAVEWGEYELQKLFTSSNGDFDIQKTHINDRGDYVITAGLTDNGVLGKTDINSKIFNKGTITVDMFGCAFYRQFPYKMVTHARVFSLKPLLEFTDKQGIFLATSLNFLKQEFGYGNMCSWEKIKTKVIQLPVKYGQIDFEFMEQFIAELEARRVAELNNYLLITGLKDYSLTVEEEKTLSDFNAMTWGTCKVGSLFERVKTKKLSYKAKDLPKSPFKEYVLPALTSSFQNQGLNYYVPIVGATVLNDVISIPSNSDVYRAYYQSKEFTVLSDAYAIRWRDEKERLLPQQYLFFVMCINKVTDLPIYSYKNKLGGWNVVKNKQIMIPTKNGEIDFGFMKNFISAIQKLVIKDVVLYADSKIEATKSVIKSNIYKF